MVSGTRANSEYTDGTTGIYLDYFALPWLKGRRYADLHDTTLGYYWSFPGSVKTGPRNDQGGIVQIAYLLPFSHGSAKKSRVNTRRSVCVF